MEPAPPFLYQAWKHHLPFLKERLAIATYYGEHEAGIADGLKKMGDSVSDLYIGRISLMDLTTAIREKLGKKELSDPKSYLWSLGEERYRTLRLTDGSEWVLKYAERPDRWVHFHPARRAPLSIRVRGKTLRTAFLTCLEAKRHGMLPLNTGLVELVRSSYMGLPPVASLDRKKGLGRIITLLWGDP